MANANLRSNLTDRESLKLLTYAMEGLTKSLDELKHSFSIFQAAALVMRVDRLERLVWGILAAVAFETLTLIGGMILWSLTSKTH